MSSKASPDASQEISKDPLVEAIGRAIKDRRRELHLHAGDLPPKLNLSPSYYRSIEAGTIAAPPNAAIALSFALEWEPACVSELLCALPYIAAGDAMRKRELFERGVASEILNLEGSIEDRAAAVRRFVEPGRKEPKSKQSSRTQIAGTPSLPWMFELSIRRMTDTFEQSINRMTADISSLPFYVDKSYLKTFLVEYKERIRCVAAYLSYTPNGSMFESSDYDFGFFFSTPPPDIHLAFHDRSKSAPSVKRDLIRALARLTANVQGSGNLASRTAEADRRLTVKGESRPRTLIYNPEDREIEFSGKPGTYSQQFKNAWIYEIEADDAKHWVGFLDSYDPETAEYDFPVIALSLENAKGLHDRILK